MRFSLIYLIFGLSMMVVSLILTLNGYMVLGQVMPVVLMILAVGILLWFFEYLVKANRKNTPSYEEILKIYNRMLQRDKEKQKRTKKKVKEDAKRGV